MSADLSWLLCSRSRTGRRLGLWDITKAETTLRNVPNAGRNMSASRARSSLRAMLRLARERRRANNAIATRAKSEEHTSELQSRQYLVCRLLLEKKNKNT